MLYAGTESFVRAWEENGVQVQSVLLTRITNILQRGEEVHALKPIYSKRSGPSLACLPGTHHLNVNLLGIWV